MIIEVIRNGKKTRIETEEKSILKALAQNGIYLNAYCAGRGLCGKCIIKYLSTPPEVSKIEQKHLKDDELNAGYRLACMHEIKDGDTIEILTNPISYAEEVLHPCVDKKTPQVALDIGTTTIAASLIKNGKAIKTARMLNPQVAFGADVLSRISYLKEHGGNLLFDVLQSGIERLLKDLLNKQSLSNIDLIVVSANPTILSFFLDLNPESIGQYPYRPPFIGSLTTKWRGIDTYIPPVIGAFVGSDISSGLIEIEADLGCEFLFMDIGTNCEFILSTESKLLAASVPAGPALEGAGIDYGSIASEGAIERVIFDGTLKCKTIGGKKATGIAGSGLISAIALLRRYGIIDSTGRLLEPWEVEEAPLQLISRLKKEGFLLENNIFLTKNSIRAFQLAKAALNAGITILLHRSDNSKVPQKLYISGGFTKSLTEEDLRDSGLIELNAKPLFLGNSALSGASKLLCESNRKKVEALSKRIEYIEIANQKEFEKLFIEKMAFT